jgi:ribonuclease HI
MLIPLLVISLHFLYATCPLGMHGVSRGINEINKSQELTTPGPDQAKSIRTILSTLEREGRTAEIQWVKGHPGIPGNEHADVLAGRAAEKTARSKFISLAYLMQVSENFRVAKHE